MQNTAQIVPLCCIIRSDFANKMYITHSSSNFNESRMADKKIITVSEGVTEGNGACGNATI